jgi:hypothetical protein
MRFAKIAERMWNFYDRGQLKLKLKCYEEKRNYKDSWEILVLRYSAMSNILDTPPPEPRDELDEPGISEDDRALIRQFHEALQTVTMDECDYCNEKWFEMHCKAVGTGINAKNICRRCSNKPNVFWDSNNMDPGKSIQDLARDLNLKVPEPLSQVEEMMISPVISSFIMLTIRFML